MARFAHFAKFRSALGPAANQPHRPLGGHAVARSHIARAVAVVFRVPISGRSLPPSGCWPAVRDTSVDCEGPGRDAIVLRALRPGDRHLVALILEGLGPESRLQRFLAARPVFSGRDLFIVTRIDGVDHAGVIAFAGSPAAPVGAAHDVRAEHPGVAETAIEVVDDWQRRGIGRLLIAELSVRAVRAGIRHFEWFAFESNRAVAALVRDFGDCRRTRVGNGVIKWSAPI
jgi:GNAT superfamily N-acetyltransferase